jgi:hypothetical protein
MSTMIGPCPRPEDLAGWLEGSLSPEERGPLTAHLASCDDCRRTVEVATLVDEAPARPVDEVLLARIVTASRRRPAWTWAVAAAALLAVVLGIVLSRPAPQAIPVAEEAPKAMEAPVARKDVPAVKVEEPPAKVEEKPQPVVEAPKPEPEKPKTPPPVEPTKEVAKVEEKPKPEPEKPKEPVQPPPPVDTTTDLAAIFKPVYVVDPTGDLRLRGAKPGAFEQASFLDSVSTREGAGFTLDTHSSVALEKGAAAGFSWFKPDQAYTIHAAEGLVIVDTEGTTHSFRVTRGGATLLFPNLNGALAVEPRGDQVAATLLRGKADLRIGAETKKAVVGREVVLAADGKTAEQAGETRKKLDRLMALRPKSSTIFAASFDEKKDEVNPFPYTVLVGRVATGPSGLFLEGIAASGAKPEVAAALKPDRAIPVTSDMVVRFRYRTTLASFTVKLGQHQAVYVSKARPGQWAEGEIRRDAFTHEGVELVPSTEVSEVRFTGVVPKGTGTLEVDALQFLRRAR